MSDKAASPKTSFGELSLKTTLKITIKFASLDVNYWEMLDQDFYTVLYVKFNSHTLTV